MRTDPIRVHHFAGAPSAAGPTPPRVRSSNARPVFSGPFPTARAHHCREAARFVFSGGRGAALPPSSAGGDGGLCSGRSDAPSPPSTAPSALRRLTRTDVWRMRVAELRKELSRRGVEDVGRLRRPALVERLLEAIAFDGAAARQRGGADDDHGKKGKEGAFRGRTYILRFDGGSRGNPGVAGAGAVLYDEDAAGGTTTTTEAWSGQRFLEREATNNEAGYAGLILGLRAARSLGAERIVIEGDSQLIVRQLEGTYRVKSPTLRPLYYEAVRLLDGFDAHRVRHIPRQENWRADELANQAVETGTSSGIDFPEYHGTNSALLEPSVPLDPSDETSDFVSPKSDNQPLENIQLKDINQPSSQSSNLRPTVPISSAKTYILRFDGGSRGNPGLAGAGMALFDADDDDGNGGGETEVWSGMRLLDRKATNNEAEYEALIAGLRSASALGVLRVIVEGDSQLIVRQLEGTYRVKSPTLRPLYEEAVRLLDGFDAHQVRHIPRQENWRADELANRAVDEGKSLGCDFD